MGQFDHLPYRPCVGICLVNHKGEVFTGQRRDKSSDAWQMPQGGIDDGETPVEAAWRELGEETGLSADHARLITESQTWRNYDLPNEFIPRFWHGRFRGQTQRWFLFRFTGRDADINIQAHDQEFSAWQWMPMDDVPERIVPFKREIYLSVIAEFRNVSAISA